MNRPLFSLTKKALFAGVIALCFARTSGATTYYWKNSTGTTDYKVWDEVDSNDGTYVNWSTESTTGANASSLPGTSDTVKQVNVAYDLNGGDWSVGTFGANAGWQGFSVRNGTLTVTKQYYGQYGTHRWNGVHLIVPVGSEARTGASDANPTAWNLVDGTVLDIFGKMNSFHARVSIDATSTLNFNPSSYATDGGSTRYDEWKNNGTFNLPNGMKMTSGSLQCRVIQQGGTMNLGGDLAANGHNFTFTWSGGTVNVMNDATLDGVTVAVSSSVTLNVDSGASFTIPASATFASGITLTKTGAGCVRFQSANLPPALVMSAGTLILDTANTSYDLSDVTFAAGTKLQIGATCVTLSSWDTSLANVTFSAASGFSPANGATVLTCADATILSAAESGLNASLPAGLSVSISGNSLVVESHYTFNSTTVTDMTDPDGWLGGAVGVAGQPITIAGAGVAPVMDDDTPAYAAISVADGASLTVASERTIPAISLAAGSALNVSGTSMLDMSFAGYLPTTETLVGTMDPSCSITEIADVSGLIGGSAWAASLKNTPYSVVAVSATDGGTKLIVQFKQYESPYTKCVVVEFSKDSSGNIYAKAVKAAYKQDNSGPRYDVDFSVSGSYTTSNISTSDGAGNYGVKNLSFKAPSADTTQPSTVTATGDFATTGSGSVTVDVAENCVLDLSGVDVVTAATLVKTGPGTIAFGEELPSALQVNAGILAVQPYVEYDMTAVTIANDVTIKVVVDGEYQPCIATPGQNGTTVYMTGDTYVGVGGWDTLANWASGALPNASATAHIFGADTVLTLNASPATMPAVISVEGGATLKITADITLPPLAIDPASKVVFGDNATQPAVAAVLDASLSTTADPSVTPVALPVIEIATNATLTIPGAMIFKNVDFRLYGTLAKAALDVKGPVFGYATNGETNYIAFTADGCDFDIHADTDRDPTLAQINFLCPDSGGTVKAVGTIMLKNSTRHCNGWKDMSDIRVGEHNPTTEPFDVLIDGTHLDISGRFYAYGAAHISLVNGSYIRREINCLAHGFNMAIGDAATVDVESGCYINFTTGAGAFGIDSQSAVDTVSVRGGGVYSVTANSSGWGRGIFVSDGGILGVHRIYDSRTRTDLLRGFASVRLDGDLAIKSLNVYATGGHFSNPNRHAQMADIPFAGAGDVVVTNGVPSDRLSITMVNGANTATGSIRVNKVEGDAETALFFANGANWAGTVVAGDVSLTNLTDGATAATVDFGALDLAAGKTFPVRVWTHSGPVANDTINVGQYVNNGGELVPTLMDGAPGEKITGDTLVVIGKIAKTSPSPKVPSRWRMFRKPIEGDDDNEELSLKPFVGMQIILR